MKVKNETRYDTRQLSRLFRWCLKERGIDPKRGRYGEPIMRVVKGREGVSGYAWLHSRNMVIRMPSPMRFKRLAKRLRKSADYLEAHGTSEHTTPEKLALWRRDADILDATSPNVDAHRVARVIIHELDHNLGLRHKDMAYSGTINTDGLPLEEVEHRPAKPKPKRDLVVTRYQRAAAHLATWQRKLKLAKTKVAGYKRTVARYERQYPERVAACTKGT